MSESKRKFESDYSWIIGGLLGLNFVQCLALGVLIGVVT